jgi:endonuclease YncB( thermonuclease family)
MLAGAILPAAAARRQIVDGDTIRIGAEEIRLTGFDTPETASAKCRSERRAGRAAKRVLAELLHKRRLILQRRGTDKYGRTLARGEIGGRDVAQLMIESGHARRYVGGRRKSWCR